jgi:hypothetical protein
LGKDYFYFCAILRLPLFRQFEVYRRKPHTIEKVVKIVENMAESLDQDIVHSAVSNV